MYPSRSLGEQPGSIQGPIQIESLWGQSWAVSFGQWPEMCVLLGAEPSDSQNLCPEASSGFSQGNLLQMEEDSRGGGGW